MDIELRWILIAISIIVLLLIVFDGWRRIKRQQKGTNGNKVADFSEDEHETLAENFVDDYADEGEDSQNYRQGMDADILDEEEVIVRRPESRTEPRSEPILETRREASLSETHSNEEEGIVSVKKTAVVIDDTIDTMQNALFVLNIFAQPGSAFTGSQLLPALLSLGMRFGDMSIFHRHEHINGNGATLFSLASATEPGIFNLNNMESQNFSGLTLFLQVPGPAHPINALNLMVQTAKRLAKTLDGNVFDDERLILTDNNLERRYYFRLRQILGKI